MYPFIIDVKTRQISQSQLVLVEDCHQCQKGDIIDIFMMEVGIVVLALMRTLLQ